MSRYQKHVAVATVLSGKPQLEEKRVLPVQAVIWGTGFQPDYTWINLSIFDEYGYPRHTQGVVRDAPRLYFVGLLFQSALSSALLGSVGADAGHIAQQMGRNIPHATQHDNDV